MGRQQFLVSRARTIFWVIFKTKKMKKVILLVVTIVAFSSCSNNYSNGNRVGFVTQFSKAGLIWKSWEGHLNMTQTGMNSSSAFDFSVDNDKEDISIISDLQLALDSGYKVELTYNLAKGYNWFSNRGNTDYFVSHCKIIKENNKLLNK
jgi:hypothetical protein